MFKLSRVIFITSIIWLWDCCTVALLQWCVLLLLLLLLLVLGVDVVAR